MDVHDVRIISRSIYCWQYHEKALLWNEGKQSNSCLLLSDMFAAWHFIGISKISIMKISLRKRSLHDLKVNKEIWKLHVTFFERNYLQATLLNYTFSPLILAQTASNWIYYTFAQMCENHLSLSTFLFFHARSHLARQKWKTKGNHLAETTKSSPCLNSLVEKWFLKAFECKLEKK